MQRCNVQYFATIISTSANTQYFKYNEIKKTLKIPNYHTKTLRLLFRHDKTWLYFMTLIGRCDKITFTMWHAKRRGEKEECWGSWGEFIWEHKNGTVWEGKG